MLRLTLVHLAPDLRSAQPGLDRHEVGVVAPEQLLAVLEQFQQLDPVANQEAEPHLLILSGTGRHLVRTERGRLFLYDARDPSVPYRELTPAEILAAATPPGGAAPPPAMDPATQLQLERETSMRWLWRRPGLAVALLAGCVLLNLYTFWPVLHRESVHSSSPTQLITDDAERAALRQAAAGRYTTGGEPGDRGIEIRVDGEVRFTRLRSGGERLVAASTYRFARGENGALSLVTPRHGVIEVRNIDTLVYFGDTYRRPR